MRHEGVPGSAGRYARGCRCSECIEASRVARTQYRRRHNPDPMMLVQCWCEQGTARRPASEIFAGLTGPCYRERCQSMNKLARREHQRRQSA